MARTVARRQDRCRRLRSCRRDEEGPARAGRAQRLGTQVAKFETEIDSVRQREDRDRALLDGGAVAAKQVTEIQHELETLQRRQASLEDSLLEVSDLMPRFMSPACSLAVCCDSELRAKGLL